MLLFLHYNFRKSKPYKNEWDWGSKFFEKYNYLLWMWNRKLWKVCFAVYLFSLTLQYLVSSISWPCLYKERLVRKGLVYDGPFSRTEPLNTFKTSVCNIVRWMNGPCMYIHVITRKFLENVCFHSYLES